MNTKGTIVIVEDDKDDCEILEEIFAELQVKNPLRFCANGKEALQYLLETEVQPFLIITDVNLPLMNGIELRRRINENEYLRRKSIPFVFLSTSTDRPSVNEAYDMMVQGFFRKEPEFSRVKETLRLILEYWQVCKHPNNLE